MNMKLFFLGLIILLFFSCNCNEGNTFHDVKPSEINIYIYDIPVYRENKFVLKDSIIVIVDTVFPHDKNYYLQEKLKG